MPGTRKKDGAMRVLCVCLIVCLISMIGASLIQSDFGRVEVSELNLAMKDGRELSVLLYRPRAATSENPLPLIITCHGSYNNKEMQDQNCIELSRRGFVVMSMDSYGHGSSSSNATSDERYAAMIELVEYSCTSLNYIDQDKIGITGHSMGAKICNTTVEYYLAQEQLGLGPNRIAAIFNVGTNPSYDPPEVEGLGTLKMKVDFGLIAAKYDEWNYRSPDVGDNVLRFLESDNARKFINQVNAGVTGDVEAGKYYTGEIDGESYLRVIYQPLEIHPKNHFSKTCAAEISEFFYETFGVPQGYERIDVENQVWQWKEGLNGIGMLAVFVMLFPLGCLVMKLPLFQSLVQEQPAPAPALKGGKAKLVFWGTWLINALLPAALFVPVGWILVGKSSHVPSTYNAVFGQPNTNELTGWSVVAALVLLAVFLLTYGLYGRKHGASVDSWGVKTSAKNFFKALLAAFTVIWLVYNLVFFADFFFQTDFRFWMLALKTFNREKVFFALVYVCGFTAFYLVNSLLVNGGNRVSGFAEWKILLISCVGNILGIAILVLIQYSRFVTTGVLTFNAMRIVNIFPLLVFIPAGTIVSRFYFKKTGNIYMGSFVIGMLYAIMTCANTWSMGSIF